MKGAATQERKGGAHGPLGAEAQPMVAGQPTSLGCSFFSPTWLSHEAESLRFPYIKKCIGKRKDCTIGICLLFSLFSSARELPSLEQARG